MSLCCTKFSSCDKTCQEGHMLEEGKFTVYLLKIDGLLHLTSQNAFFYQLSEPSHIHILKKTLLETLFLI